MRADFIILVSDGIEVSNGSKVVKIMIIDDSAVMRRIIRNTLLVKGLCDDFFLEAENGEMALELAINNPVDVFLVDWNMPKIDGLKLVKILRGLAHHKNTPIIMITARSAKYNVMEAVAAGVTDYIIKPVRGDTLWDKIWMYFIGAQV
jgi:two-component system chemotaxis response regulator CheY